MENVMQSFNELSSGFKYFVAERGHNLFGMMWVDVNN